MSGASPQSPTGSDDQALLQRLRTGEDAAFEELVRSHSGRMLSVAKRFLRNEDDAHDAVQEAFLSAFRGLERFQGEAKLATWLHRIVVNASLMKLRSRRRKPESSLEELLPKFIEDGHMQEPTSGWLEASDLKLEREEMRKLLLSSIDELPDSYRSVLLLRDVEELDTDETAQALEMSPGAVKTRLHRARQALRTLLDPHFRERAA